MLLLSDDSWEIREKKRMGKAIFLKKDVPAGTVIADYLGIVIRPQDEDNYDNGEHFYLMYYHDYASIFPNLKKPGAHLLNHSCTPNCWMYTYKGHTLYFAIRKIFAGEELTIHYLLSPQDKGCNPCDHLCHCGAVLCFQTMHLSDEKYKQWEKIHDEQAHKTVRERVKFGQELQRLSDYPNNIPDHPIYTLFGAQSKHAITDASPTLPIKNDIRKIIRETGRSIAYPKLNLRIHGVIDDLLISETLK